MPLTFNERLLQKLIELGTECDIPEAEVRRLYRLDSVFTVTAVAYTLAGKPFEFPLHLRQKVEAEGTDATPARRPTAEDGSGEGVIVNDS